ncbi:MAG: SdrD B-like domain-containing protein, partial [Dolichospermum sp.]
MVQHQLKKWKWQKMLSFLLLFMITANVLNAQISGTVFRDFDANGIKASTTSTSLEPGVSGVTVKAYPSSGAVQTTTTNASGAYSFSGLTLPARIEFTNLPSGNYTGPQGSGSATTVQFYSAATSNANLGINNPSHYSQANPFLVTPKYLNGNPFNDLGGNIANEDALYMYPFGATGDRQSGGTSATVLATQAQIGSTWGTAYSSQRKKLFVASVYKRHSPLGPGETGGRIYVIDNPTGTPSTPTKFIDLVTDLGISVGATETNSARSLATNKFNSSSDDNAFSKVGKVGLGDLDVSDDGQFLFVTNLHDKRIYKINIAQVIAGTPNATALPSFTIPSCPSGEARPWGMGMWDGELYAGVICDASSGSRNDLRGYVQKFNFTSNTWTTVLTFTPTWLK